MRTLSIVLVSASAGALVAYLLTREVRRRRPLPPRLDRKIDPEKIPEEIVQEQLARNRAFLGDAGVEAIRKRKVVVVGVGGVGSWVATMLTRSGIGALRMVDFDQVTLSSLNRHACATLADVGTPKVECLANYLSSVCPWVHIEPVRAVWDGSDEAKALLDGADAVVDCIDNVDTKVELIAYCYHSGIRIVSSMGAGCKADPTRIMIGDISRTIEDPLSRVTRIRLRKRGVHSGVPVVFSTEKPSKEKARLLDIDDSIAEEGNLNELSVLPNFRVRVMPVLGPVQAVFALTIAAHLVTDFGGYHYVYDPVLGGYSLGGKNRTKTYEGLVHSIAGQFTRMGWPEATQMTVSSDDAGYLLDEVWRGRSITGQYNRLHLTVWDPRGPRNIHNMVPVNKEQQRFHEANVLTMGRNPADVYDSAVLETVQKRQALDRWYSTMR